MKHWLRRHMPDHVAISEHRWLKPFANTLLHPRLWHLNRRSAAGAVAVGLFCGLIPGPFQMISAAIGAVIFRINLPLAMFVTLYTNPLTIVPLYMVAYTLGLALTGGNGGFSPPPDYGEQGFIVWIEALINWLLSLGMPLAVGLIALACILALIGYVLVRILWRIVLVRAWHRRRKRRKQAIPQQKSP
ncbi:MAG: DUF2062 domain-containing protein [Rhodocyclaceae bacterium]|nr:DUF2062 domain-containing protein [Rhodocyclaceae bacterium]